MIGSTKKVHHHCSLRRRELGIVKDRDIGGRSWLRDPMKLISPLDGVCFLVLIKKLSY